MEKTVSISSARQQLMKLARHVNAHMDRIVFTNKGRAETVLVSVAEYQSLRAAAQLLSHPEALRTMNEGFAEIARGKGVPLERAFGLRAAKPAFAAKPSVSER